MPVSVLSVAYTVAVIADGYRYDFRHRYMALIQSSVLLISATNAERCWARFART